ncbi:C4-dicarboxylate ABC transporter [Sneathiella chungangensis]|uniref:C4-dicarboxylate ABC transporter n=1 Tax=Sneathiella chungangensis TaxID=1418234 RepID=A0A845MGR7_9PROT|nr:TRAP transporter substrate-binding protein DctP [Sneathiella chungangensis]MZR23198.1 C4-dicarboxylate ABC transporter [Sneathiella chungangensis]
MIKKLKTMSRLFVLGTGFLGCLASSAAIAEDKVIFKVADIFPTTHYILLEGTQKWMDKAVELSNGRIEFQYFPAQQLGKAKDIMSLTSAGVADIGVIIPAYVPEKLPLSAAGELPGMFNTACSGSQALADLTKPGGILYEQEFKPQGFHVLYTNMLAPYTVMTSEKELNSYKDLAGLKLYASGDAKHETLTKLGATPIRLSGPEIFEAVQRGTLDGAMLAYIGLPPYSLDELMKYGLTGVNLGSTTVTYGMTSKKWNSLDKEIQDALTEAAAFAGNALCSYSDRMNSEALEALKGGGAKIHVIEGEEAAALNKELEPVITNWTSVLEERGKPAKEVIEQFRSAVSKYE